METIAGLYAHFSLNMSDGYKEWLKEESRRTDEYASARQLSLEEVGYDAQRVKENFADIYERFNFSKSDGRNSPFAI